MNTYKQTLAAFCTALLLIIGFAACRKPKPDSTTVGPISCPQFYHLNDDNVCELDSGWKAVLGQVMPSHSNAYYSYSKCGCNDSVSVIFGDDPTEQFNGILIQYFPSASRPQSSMSESSAAEYFPHPSGDSITFLLGQCLDGLVSVFRGRFSQDKQTLSGYIYARAADSNTWDAKAPCLTVFQKAP